MIGSRSHLRKQQHRHYLICKTFIQGWLRDMLLIFGRERRLMWILTGRKIPRWDSWKFGIAEVVAIGVWIKYDMFVCVVSSKIVWQTNCWQRRYRSQHKALAHTSVFIVRLHLLGSIRRTSILLFLLAK